MANRATKFVSAIFVSAVVGIPVSTFAKDDFPDPEKPETHALTSSLGLLIDSWY